MAYFTKVLPSLLLLQYCNFQPVSGKIAHTRNVLADPEAYMKADEIIKYHGYPVTVYNVTTADGYILQIERIPYGKNDRSDKPRQPVLVQHGWLMSSSSWVINTEDKNLPYILADAGYDVWLGNIRGTEYGRRNLRLKPSDKAFWEFSFDEYAKYDVPAVIDQILQTTGHKQIHYIGHSMGTNMMFILLSTQPKYNEIIRTFNALAPITRMKYASSPPLKLIAPFINQLDFFLNLFTTGEYLPNSPLEKLITSVACSSPIKLLCTNLIFLMSGYSPDQLNATRLPTYLQHVPAGTSVQQFAHFAQFINSGKFQKFDYGKLPNLIKYGQFSPPEYNLGAITTKVALYWSDNDLLSVPRDNAWAAGQLKNLILNYRVPLKSFAHVDFVWGLDVKKLVYDQVIATMREQWKD